MFSSSVVSQGSDLFFLSAGDKSDRDDLVNTEYSCQVD